MSELKPCPFCGGEAEKMTSSDGFTSIGCLKCNPLFGIMVQRTTEAEAIAAWNSREKPPCDGGYCPLCSAAERTCHWELEHSGTLYDKWRCSKCGYLFVEPRCDQGYTDLDPNFCPKCGAKVVS